MAYELNVHFGAIAKTSVKEGVIASSRSEEVCCYSLEGRKVTAIRNFSCLDPSISDKVIVCCESGADEWLSASLPGGSPGVVCTNVVTIEAPVKSVVVGKS